MPFTPRRNPLLQITHQRLDRLIARLEAVHWQRLAELPVLAGAAHADWLELEAAQAEPQQPLSPRQRLGKAWQQRWCRVRIPAGEPGRRLLWKCQGEATVWRDGVPWAGLDGGHRTCAVTDDEHDLWLAVGCWQTGFWAAGVEPVDADGIRYDGCELVRRDGGVAAALQELILWRQLITQLAIDAGLDRPSRIGWCQDMDRVEPLLRRLLGGLDEVIDAHTRGGLPALIPALMELARALPAAPWSGRVAAVPHSHIDLVYLWPERVAVEKHVHTVATQLRLLDEHPDFRFTHSQPLSCRQLARRSPALVDAIRQRIAEGRWELTGGFACEPDTHLPCGEALFRSLRLGQSITVSMGAPPATVCWLPDVFGYSACLPALLRLAGIEGFVTAKLCWSQLTRFPATSFIWRGPDGSEICAHLVAVGYNTAVHDLVKNLVEATRAHREVHIHDELLLPVGMGDGGGGPDESLVAALRLAGDRAGLPRTRIDRADSFIARLCEHADRLPVHQGELYLEYHRGVLTSQQRLKAAYRRGEQAAQAWEAARCTLGGGAIPEAVWERLCFAQFHDALPGTSIAEPMQAITEELEALAGQCRATAIAELGGSGELPFNPLPYAILHHDGARSWALPGLGTGTVRDDLPPVATAPGILDNGMVQFRFIGGCLAGASGLPLRGGTLTLAEDHPANYDAWEVEASSLRLAQPFAPESLTVAGPGRLRGRCAVGTASQLTIDYVLDPGAEHLRIELDIDWQEEHRLLRYELDTACAGRQARFGCAFASVLRPQQPGPLAAEAMWEVPASRWAAALRDDGEGVALLSASNWGYSSRDGVLGVSLLRAPRYPDPGCDRGRHRLHLAIGPWRGSFTADGRLPTAAAAEALFLEPLRVARAWTPPITVPVVGGSLIPAWLSPGTAGIELRAHETAGSPGTLRLAACSIDALDRLGPEQREHHHGPYAVLSLVLPRR